MKLKTSICVLFACAASATAQTSVPAPAYLSLATLDRNADQQVTEGEFLAAAAPSVAARFAGIDTNRDGVLSPGEVEVARAASLDRLRKLAADDPARSEYSAMPAFAEMDTNQDGRLDKAEFGAAQERSLRQRFQVLDANGDGALSAAEFEAARSRFLQQVGRPPETGAP